MSKELSKEEFDEAKKTFRKVMARRKRERKLNEPFTMKEYQNVMDEVSAIQAIAEQEYHDDVFDYLQSLKLTTDPFA